MTTLLIDPFSSGMHYHDLLRADDVEYYVVRTRRALDSALSDGGSVPLLAFDKAGIDLVPELERFCQQRSIDVVITGAESGVPLAEALKIQLGLGSQDFQDQGRRFWDKALLYDIIQKAGLRAPEQFGVITADMFYEQRHQAVLQNLPMPMVIKPDVGAGSVDVKVVQTPKETDQAIEAVVSEPGFFGGQAPNAVLQEFISGQEYVVDSFSSSGEHHIMAICAYDKHRSAAGSMVYDRLRWLDPQSSEASPLKTQALKVLEALDHREGSVHMEFMADGGTPCLIDLGARPHGAGHPLKTYHLTGDSQLHIEVKNAAGHPPVSKEYQLTSHAAIEFLSLDRPGVVRVDADPSELLRQDFVLSGEVQAMPGTRYPATESLLDSEALGLLFVTGSDVRQVEENSRALRRAFSTMVEESVGAA